MERSLLLSFLLGVLALAFTGLGVLGLMRRKPIVLSSRWSVLGLVPAVAFLVDLSTRHFDAEGLFRNPLLVIAAATGLLILGLVLWVVRQGKYIFVGVTEKSFKAALQYALRQLGLPYRESLAGMRLEALGVDLKVTVQGSFGWASLEIQPRAAYPHLSQIVQEMWNYFTTNPVRSNPLPYVIYSAAGGLLAAAVAALAFLGSLVSSGRSHKEWVGRLAPDFRLETMRGESLALSDRVGKEVLVINFFATWCGPCRHELPELERFSERHAGRPVSVLGIDSNETEAEVSAFVERLRVTYPVAIDPGEVSRLYGVQGFPTTVVIGADGRIRDYRGGAIADVGATLGELVEAALAEIREGKGISRENYLMQHASEVQGIMPEHLREVKVLQDRIGLRRSVFARHATNCSSVTDIAVGDFDPSPGQEVLVVDCEKSRTFDLSGRPLGLRRFPRRMRHPKILTPGPGSDRWLVVDEAGWDEIKAISESGRVLWRRPWSGEYRAVSAGNIDADALPEYVLWAHDTPGLELLDDDGSVLRRIDAPDPVRAAYFVKEKHPSGARIFYTILDKDLVLLDLTGREISRHKPGAPVLNFLDSFVWPELTAERVYLQTFWQTLNLFTLDGARVIQLIAPSLENQLLFVPARSAVLRFPGRSESYLVFSTRLYSHPRTALHVFDAEGTLVYHELLENQYGGLAVIPEASGHTRALLVGGRDEILQYEPGSPEASRIGHSRQTHLLHARPGTPGLDSRPPAEVCP